MLVPESSEHETILIKYKRKIGDLLKMGVLDKFLSIMKLDDGDDEYDDDEFFDDDEYENLQNRFIQAIKLLRCVSLQEEAV